MLLAQTLAGAGVANDAAKVSAITAGVGLDSLLNPTSLRLRQVAKQPKYNGNPDVGLSSNGNLNCGLRLKNSRMISS